MLSIVGREDELASVRGLAVGEGGVRGLVLVGEPGSARRRCGRRGSAPRATKARVVLVSRPSESEARLPFTGLIDLCEHVGSGEFAALPAPQRRALEAALLRAEPMDGSAHAGAVAFGFVAAVRVLAARTPLVIAVDDLQWLDRSSADVLAFAARRLRDLSVGFLLARRPTRVTELERALEHGSVVRVELGALTLGAVRRMLWDRLGLTVSRPLLRRVVDVTQGNPLFALEIGRSLLEHEAQGEAAEIPLPDSVEEIVGGRVAQLASGVRTVLLATALSDDLRVAMLSAVAGSDAVEDALHAGVLVLDGERVRAAHPLLAAVASKRSSVRERRELHRALAGAMEEGPLRALHLALASTGVDEDLAAKLVDGAHEASARGGRQQAVELARHALRLTAAESDARGERVLALASALYEAGELRRLTKLLSEELESLPTGAMRARARLLLGEGYGSRSLDDTDDQLELALVEAGDDPALRAYLPGQASGQHGRRSRGPPGRRRGLGARGAARSEWAGGRASRAVRAGLGSSAERRIRWMNCARARMWRRIPARTSQPVLSEWPASATFGGARSHRRAERSPACFRLLTNAARKRRTCSYACTSASSRCARASGTLRARCSTSGLSPQTESSHSGLSTSAAGRCSPPAAATTSTRSGGRVMRSRGRRRPPVAGMSSRHGAHAGSSHSMRARPSGRFRTSPWCGTTLSARASSSSAPFRSRPSWWRRWSKLDRLAEARTVAGDLARLARQHDHPWALASAKRSRALLQLGSDRSAAMLRAAAGDFERLGLRFDAARSLLALGRVQRRAKQWRAARDALADAASAFERLGSPGWAELARAEHERVPGRRPATSGELTPTERRVVELAAGGLPNKKIATTLFVTVHTVEVHLAHAYAKLGVRSRTQLAARLLADAQATASAPTASPKD